jgi:hypothetical protein
MDHQLKNKALLCNYIKTYISKYPDTVHEEIDGVCNICIDWAGGAYYIPAINNQFLVCSGCYDSIMEYDC